MESARVFQHSSPGASDSTTRLMERLKEMRGDHNVWLRKEIALSKYIANVCQERVLCKGEWHGPSRHYPAVLTYNEHDRICRVWLPQGNHDEIIQTDLHHFHSTIPHVGVAREVFSETNANSTI